MTLAREKRESAAGQPNSPRAATGSCTSALSATDDGRPECRYYLTEEILTRTDSIRALVPREYGSLSISKNEEMTGRVQLALSHH